MLLMRLLGKLTQAPSTPTIDTGAGDENIIDDGEDAFATNKRAIFMLHFAIEKRSGFVQFNATPMARFGEWDFLRMKIVPT